MKKQTSTMSNTSDGAVGGGRGNGRNRRNTQGKEPNYQAKGGPGPKEAQQARPEPIKVSEEQLKTKIQVMFSKFIKEQEGGEEDKSEENLFQPVKELIQSGVLTSEEDGEKEKKIRADDIFSAWLQKSIDLNHQ